MAAPCGPATAAVVQTKTQGSGSPSAAKPLVPHATLEPAVRRVTAVSRAGWADRRIERRLHNPPWLSAASSTRAVRSSHLSKAALSCEFVAAVRTTAAEMAGRSSWSAEPVAGHVSGSKVQVSVKDAIAGEQRSNREWTHAGRAQRKGGRRGGRRGTAGLELLERADWLSTTAGPE